MKVGRMNVCFRVKDGSEQCDTAVISSLLSKWLSVSTEIGEKLEHKLASGEFLMWDVELDKQGVFFLACKIYVCRLADFKSFGKQRKTTGYEIVKNAHEEIYVQESGFQVSVSAAGTSCPATKEELIDWIEKDAKEVVPQRSAKRTDLPPSLAWGMW